MESIKNCPFCGSHKVSVRGLVHYWVKCETCLAEGSIADTMERAVEKWNQYKEGGRGMTTPEEHTARLRQEGE